MSAQASSSRSSARRAAARRRCCSLSQDSCAERGTVTIGGARVERPFTDVGIVFQDPVLLDWRDVLANVMLQADVRGLDRDATRERSRALLARVGLDGFLHRHPYELSGGMRQRVSICRAWCTSLRSS
jgi:ABC-type nitrate/sulfonate/bicarbonate transport system ATPase subunit